VVFDPWPNSACAYEATVAAAEAHCRPAIDTIVDWGKRLRAAGE